MKLFRQMRASSVWVVPGLLITCLFLAGCSRQLLSVFFDVPPDEESSGESPASTALLAGPAASPVFEDTLDLAIEQTLDPDSVLVLLPRDHAGNVDWMEALRGGVISPRSQITGPGSRNGRSDFEFAFDFFLPGPYPEFDVYFPHSAHTQWVECQQCHPRIFPKRGTQMKMEEIFQGKYCGECHGKVAFPATTGCERCHSGLVQGSGTVEPKLIGNVTMRRIASTFASAAVTDSISAPSAALTEVFPAATFSHWVHRIRYRCNVCHMEIFEPRAGANEITMDTIRGGDACGRCHDGKTAFDSGFGNCERCHVEPAALAGNKTGW